MASNESTPRTSESDGLCIPPSPDKAASRSTPYCVPEEAAGPGDKPPLGVLLFHVHDGIARDPAEGGIVCVQGRCEVCAGEREIVPGGIPIPGKTPWEKTTGRTSAVELHEAVCRCRMPDEMRATWGAHTKDLWKALALPS